MNPALAPPPDRLAVPPALPSGYVTAEDYLRWEEHAETKHEWIDGEIREMAGASEYHAALDRRIGSRLDRAFEGLRFISFSNDIKIRVPDGPYYYADGSLAGLPAEFEPPVRPGTPHTVLTNPAVIVEILSERAAEIDRGEKLDGYRSIPSLTDYLLFSQTEPVVEHHRREPGGDWEQTTYRGPAASVTLAAGGADFTLADVYSVLDGLSA
ncbi:MAG: Uma2 family endonuclease [Planctomycetota bacterium]